MKLYYSPGACSLSSHIALCESGLPFETVLTSIKSHKLQDGTDYHGINPLGYVPMLELDNGERLREGPAIMQFIADLAPEKNLAPANGSFARSRLQEWLNLISTEIHKSGFSPLFRPATPPEYKAFVQERLLSRLRWIDSQLANKPYLLGDHFSVADGYLFTVTNWSKPLQIDLSALTHLMAFQARVAARPAVQQALKTEGLLPA